MQYLEFIAQKHVRAKPSGFDAHDVDERLFPFQRHAVTWACRQGRAALFLDTGLGKTFCQLEWARQVVRHTGRKVLVLAPLAVAQQTVRAGKSWGYDCAYDREGGAQAAIVVTNYERAERFAAYEFAGVILDESGILKNADGKTRGALTSQWSGTHFRLCCSATPAPNDHKELGTQAEFLGVMRATEMMSRWFINDAGDTRSWRLKGHAVEDFWDWVQSWAMMAGLPSDLGDYSDDGYVLPELCQHVHTVETADEPDAQNGALFRMVGLSATNVHTEKRRTIAGRAARIASIVASEPDESWLIWCETDYEADALCEAIPTAVEVRGPESQDAKEGKLVGFSDGSVRVLVTKPKIAGFGMNWQNCARIAFVGATFSFESYYQAIRRCWRFGQKRPVHVHVALGTSEAPVWAILARKIADHERMKRAMFDASRRKHHVAQSQREYVATQPMQMPKFWRNAR